MYSAPFSLILQYLNSKHSKEGIWHLDKSSAHSSSKSTISELMNIYKSEFWWVFPIVFLWTIWKNSETLWRCWVPCLWNWAFVPQTKVQNIFSILLHFRNPVQWKCMVGGFPRSWPIGQTARNCKLLFCCFFCRLTISPPFLGSEKILQRNISITK